MTAPALDPFGVLMSGATSVKTGQVFNLSDGVLEGGTEVQLLSALPEFGSDALASQEQVYENLVGVFTRPNGVGGWIRQQQASACPVDRARHSAQPRRAHAVPHSRREGAGNPTP